MKKPIFKDKKEELAWLIENKEALKAEKMDSYKKADGIGTYYQLTSNKSNIAISSPPDRLNTKIVINTTKLMDSHDDVHIDGIWDDSHSEGDKMHLQEHKMEFDKIISDGEDLKTYSEVLSWKELGFDYEGETEALIFDSVVDKSRNEFMHSEYAKGRVKNHSVGMHYGKIVMCVNDEEYGSEFEAWEKYYPMIANKERADKKGYFWAVTKADYIEGSAVPKGSNVATPTLENNKSEKGIDPRVKWLDSIKCKF